MSEGPTGDKDRPDPAEDPFACSRCGVYIGGPRSNDYCDPCAREVGSKPPMRRCLGCGRDATQEQMESIDVSPPDEYYPDIRYLCRDCSRDTDTDRPGGQIDE